MYPTEEDVINNGGTTTYSKQAVADQIYFGPRAHIQFAIKAPEGLSEDDLNYFPFEHAGSKWAMSIMTVASSAWTSLAKELETLRQYNNIMRKGLIYGNLELATAGAVRLREPDWSSGSASVASPPHGREVPGGQSQFLLGR